MAHFCRRKTLTWISRNSIRYMSAQAVAHTVAIYEKIRSRRSVLALYEEHLVVRLPRPSKTTCLTPACPGRSRHLQSNRQHRPHFLQRQPRLRAHGDTHRCPGKHLRQPWTGLIPPSTPSAAHNPAMIVHCGVLGTVGEMWLGSDGRAEGG